MSSIDGNVDIEIQTPELVPIPELNHIRERIESMNKFHQVEILRILKKYSQVTLNENKYGIHVNLTELDPDIIHDLKLYVKYVDTQEVFLNSAEQQKDLYRNTYFSELKKGC